MYDSGTKTGAMSLYLSTVKDIYLQLRQEIAVELGITSEEGLDEEFPIVVYFGDLKYYKEIKLLDEDEILPMEFIFLSADGKQRKELKNIRLKELQEEIASFMKVTGGELTVSLKILDPNISMGKVNEVKSVLCEACVLRVNDASEILVRESK